MYMYTCIYIYIYVYTYMLTIQLMSYILTTEPNIHGYQTEPNMLCPVHLFRVFLLRVLESNFPGIPPINFYGHENSHPFRIKSLLESNPLKFNFLISGLGVLGYGLNPYQYIYI